MSEFSKNSTKISIDEDVGDSELLYLVPGKEIELQAEEGAGMSAKELEEAKKAEKELLARNVSDFNDSSTMWLLDT